MDTWVISTFWLFQTTLWTWVYKYLFKPLLSVLWDIYPKADLLDHMIILFLIVWGTAMLSSIVAAPIYILTTVHKGSPFPAPSPTLISFFFFYSSHSDGWDERKIIIFWIAYVIQTATAYIYGLLTVSHMALYIICVCSVYIFIELYPQNKSCAGENYYYHYYPHLKTWKWGPERLRNWPKSHS